MDSELAAHHVAEVQVLHSAKEDAAKVDQLVQAVKVAVKTAVAQLPIW